MPRQSLTPEEAKAQADAVFKAATALGFKHTEVHTLSGDRYAALTMPGGRHVIVRSERELSTLKAAQALIG